jgi:hypothetical protein
MKRINNDPSQTASSEISATLKRRLALGLGILVVGVSAGGAYSTLQNDQASNNTPQPSPYKGSRYTMRQLSKLDYAPLTVQAGDTPLSLIAEVQGDTTIMNRNIGLRDEMLTDINNQAIGAGQSLMPGQKVDVPNLNPMPKRPN